MDRIAEHWEHNSKDWTTLRGDIKVAINALNYSVSALMDEPSVKKANLTEMLFCELGAILDSVDPDPDTIKEGGLYVPLDDHQKGIALYKAPTGALEPLKAMKGYKSFAIGDEEQRLLCMDRVELWHCPVKSLHDHKDGGKLILSEEQLELIKKCRLLSPVSCVEEQLLSDPQLFTDDVETIAKRHHKGNGTHKTEYWIKTVARARALYVGLKYRENQGEGEGLKSREKNQGEGGGLNSLEKKRGGGGV